MFETILTFAQDYLLKLGFLLLNGIYIVFLLIVYKQANAMNRVIHDNGASSLINYIALVNIVIGILIFVTALVIL